MPVVPSSHWLALHFLPVSPDLVGKARLMRGGIRSGPAFLLIPGLLVLSGPAHAHDFGRTSDFYARFNEGAGVVFADVALLIAMAATGFFISIWRRYGLPQVWPALALGILAGFLLPLQAIGKPEVASLALTLIAGLAAGAALSLSVWPMRLACFLAGLTLVAGTLGGHAPGSVPLGAYAGILFALNLGTAIAAGIVTAALQRLPERITLITFRALSSWLVAIAVMMLALALRGTGA